MSSTPATEFLDRFQKHKNKLVRATANSILRSTIQFYSDSEKGDPEADASGLLVALDNRYFMVTAAHVIAEDYDSIYVILPDKELQLGGNLHFTPLPKSGKRKDDKIDLAVMELDDEVVVELLASFRFLTLDNIGISHKVAPLQYYLSVGYPVTMTKKRWGRNELRAVPFPYQTELNKSFNYGRFGFKSASHLAVEFDGEVRSESNPNLHLAPKLNGISGSGLWYLKDFATPSMVANMQLVGVVIEQVNEYPDKAIIATRIDLGTEFIRQHFDVNIPKSMTIKVNLK